MEKIDYKLRKSDTVGIIHDSRKDVRNLMKICNDLIDTVNELIDEVNSLKSESQKKDICDTCGKYIHSQGNGMIHKLCECNRE